MPSQCEISFLKNRGNVCKSKLWDLLFPWFKIIVKIWVLQKAKQRNSTTKSQTQF